MFYLIVFYTPKIIQIFPSYLDKIRILSNEFRKMILEVLANNKKR